MSSRTGHFLIHPAVGGLDTTTAPIVLGLQQPDAVTLAENILFDVSGAKRKRPGTNRYNATAITESGSGVTVTAMRDFWRYGSSRSAVQKFVATAGTQILKDDGDGVWDQIKSGWGSATAPACITIAQGYAVFSTANGADAPQTYDGTTLSALGGSPPTFAFSSYHQRRLWAAGAAANMSRISYSAGGDIATWSGGDSASLILDEDDGDQVIGLSKTFRKRLYAFKGPNVGSVWEITGSTVSDYARNKIIEGAPCVGHNTIINTPNDILWLSVQGVHSLNATEKFGDVQEAYLSRRIESVFQRINFSRISQAYGVYHPRWNMAAWVVPASGQTQNTLMLCYFPLLDKWSVWSFSSFNAASLMVARNPASSAGEYRMYLGGYDGIVRGGDRTVLSDDDGTVAYTARWRTPVYSRFDGADELTEKVLSRITTVLKPKGNYSATLEVACDDRTQSKTVSMQGAGGLLDSFILGTDRLAGSNAIYVDTPFDERTRTIELTYSQGGANQDMEVVGFGLTYAPGETHAMEHS